MEEEFEEMKTKFKYEDGKFLDNDRKENEILIIRGENTNLKKSIEKIEKELSEKEKEINELKEKNESIVKKLEKTEKELNLFSNISININNNNDHSLINYPHLDKKIMQNINIIKPNNNNNNKKYLSEIKGNIDLKIFNLKII